MKYLLLNQIWNFDEKILYSLKSCCDQIMIWSFTNRDMIEWESKKKLISTNLRNFITSCIIFVIMYLVVTLLRNEIVCFEWAFIRFYLSNIDFFKKNLRKCLKSNLQSFVIFSKRWRNSSTIKYFYINEKILSHQWCRKEFQSKQNVSYYDNRCIVSIFSFNCIWNSIHNLIVFLFLKNAKQSNFRDVIDAIQLTIEKIR